MEKDKNGSYSEALKKIEEAIQQNKDLTSAKFLHHMIVARIHISEGNYHMAKEQLIEAFKIYPDDEECYNLLNGVNGVIEAGVEKKEPR